MYFTQEDYKKIENWLQANSVKDTEFPEASNLSLNEQLAIIQKGENKRVKLEDLVNFLLSQADSELDTSSTKPIQNQAVARAIYELQNRKFIKIVEELPPISNADDNVVYILLDEVGEGNNLFTEWIKVNNIWEKVGEFSAEIDLTPYLKIEDSPFEKGSADNSAVLKGENNQVISEGGVAVGSNNIVGLKGWYYKALNINTSSKTIDVYLTKNQTFPILGTPSSVETDIAFSLKVGDTISLVNDSKYDNKFTVFGIYLNSGFIRLISKDDLPFDDIKTDANLLNGIFDPEDYSIYCLSEPDAGIADIGQGSFAAGYDNKATNGKSFAFGFNNHAYGKFSFTEGRDNEAGYAAHAEGRGTKAEGEEAHAEGLNTVASGKHSHAEGDSILASGVNSHAEGYLSQATGNSSHAEGGNWVKGATGANRINGGTAEGAGSHAEGARTTAIADYSHVEGYRSITSGPNSHAEGQLTRTGGEDTDRPTGNPGTKSGQNAHAEGAMTFAQGAGSHAEGGNTWASGNYSHTEGWQTRTYEDANNSHAEGFYTEVTSRAEHAEGEYNKSNTGTRHSVGIGTSNTKRKNAHEIMRDGKHYILNVGGYDGTNPNDSEDLATLISRLEFPIQLISEYDAGSNLVGLCNLINFILKYSDEGTKDIINKIKGTCYLVFTEGNILGNYNILNAQLSEFGYSIIIHANGTSHYVDNPFVSGVLKIDVNVEGDGKGLISKCSNIRITPINYFDSNNIPSVQSDWNQNDSTAKDYIKNRPFYSFINRPFTDFYAENSDPGWIELSIDIEDEFCIRTPYWVIGPFNDGDEESYDGLYTPYGNITSVRRDDTLFYLNTGGNDEELIIEWLNENAYGGFNINNEALVEYIPDIYIPNTIARQSEITRLENRIKELENKLNEITISETN